MDKTIPEEVKSLIVQYRFLNGSPILNIADDLKIKGHRVRKYCKGLKQYDYKKRDKIYKEILVLEEQYEQNFIGTAEIIADREIVRNKLIIVADNIATNLLENSKDVKKLNIKDSVRVVRDLVSSIKALKDEKDEEKKIPDLAMLISNLEENDIKKVTRKRVAEQIEVDINDKD